MPTAEAEEINPGATEPASVAASPAASARQWCVRRVTGTSSQGARPASTVAPAYAEGMPQLPPLVVGFDLDMTLIDTRPGFAATLQVLADETGVVLDVPD